MTQMLRVTCLALLCAASSGCANDAVPGPKKHDNFGLDGGPTHLFPWLDAAAIEASPDLDAPLADVPAVLDEAEAVDARMAESGE
jgi:hypothetical protein